MAQDVTATSPADPDHPGTEQTHIFLLGLWLGLELVLLSSLGTGWAQGCLPVRSVLFPLSAKDEPHTVLLSTEAQTVPL